MLGHTKNATTQIYAKVLEKKISEDMAALRKSWDETTVSQNYILRCHADSQGFGVNVLTRENRASLSRTFLQINSLLPFSNLHSLSNDPPVHGNISDSIF